MTESETGHIGETYPFILKKSCVTTSLLLFPQKTTSLLLMLFSNRQFVHFIRDNGKMIIHSLFPQPWLPDFQKKKKPWLPDNI